jgi:rhodanese-related sulfurtransferase
MYPGTPPRQPDEKAEMKNPTDSGRRSALGLLFACGVLAVTRVAADEPDFVDLATARAEHEAGRAVLIDIREPSEHASGVARGAQLLPMRQLASRLAEIPTDPRRPVLLICNTQNRSSATARALRQRGFTHVRYVQGGMSEWVRRGWPLALAGK